MPRPTDMRAVTVIGPACADRPLLTFGTLTPLSGTASSLHSTVLTLAMPEGPSVFPDFSLLYDKASQRWLLAFTDVDGHGGVWGSGGHVCPPRGVATFVHHQLRVTRGIPRSITAPQRSLSHAVTTSRSPCDPQIAAAAVHTTARVRRRR